jgi:hypothetical protein
MTSHESNLIAYAIQFVKNGYDGRRIANTVTSKVSLADRREIRLMCALDDLPGIIKRLEANHKQGVRS